MFILYSEAQSGSGITVIDNIAYGLADGKNWSMFHSNSKYTLESGNILTKLETSPLSVAEPSTGTFIPTTEYASYGAQRQSESVEFSKGVRSVPHPLFY